MNPSNTLRLAAALLLSMTLVPAIAADEPSVLEVPAGTVLMADHVLRADLIRVNGTVQGVAGFDVQLVASRILMGPNGTIQAHDGARGLHAASALALATPGGPGSSVVFVADLVVVPSGAQVLAGSGGSGGGAYSLGDAYGAAGGQGGSIHITAANAQLHGTLEPGAGGDGGLAVGTNWLAVGRVEGGAGADSGSVLVNEALVAPSGKTLAGASARFDATGYCEKVRELQEKVAARNGQMPFDPCKPPQDPCVDTGTPAPADPPGTLASRIDDCEVCRDQDPSEPCKVCEPYDPSDVCPEPCDSVLRVTPCNPCPNCPPPEPECENRLGDVCNAPGVDGVGCPTPDGTDGAPNLMGDGGDGGDGCSFIEGLAGANGKAGNDGWFGCSGGGNGGNGGGAVAGATTGGAGGVGSRDGGSGGDATSIANGGPGGSGGRGGKASVGADCRGGNGGAGGNASTGSATAGNGGSGGCNGGVGGAATAVGTGGSGGAGGAGNPAGLFGAPGTGAGGSQLPGIAGSGTGVCP